MNGLHYDLQLWEFPGLLEVSRQQLPQSLHVVLADVVGVEAVDLGHHEEVHVVML